MKFEGQQVNIPIKGIMRAGTDNLCADGAMNEVIGMEYKDGSWLPYKEHEDAYSVVYINGQEQEVAHTTINRVFVHKVYDSSSHFVFLLKDGSLWYEVLRSASDSVTKITTKKLAEGVKDVTFIGNTICIVAESGMKFYLWKDGDYEEVVDTPNQKIQMRVTTGLVSDLHDTAIGYELVMKASKDYNVGSEIVSSDAQIPGTRTILGEDLDKDSIIAAMAGAKGEVRDHGGLTGIVIGCIGYRMKNRDVIAATAPMLLGNVRTAWVDGDNIRMENLCDKTYNTTHDVFVESFEKEGDVIVGFNTTKVATKAADGTKTKFSIFTTPRRGDIEHYNEEEDKDVDTNEGAKEVWIDKGGSSDFIKNEDGQFICMIIGDQGKAWVESGTPNIFPFNTQGWGEFIADNIPAFPALACNRIHLGFTTYGGGQTTHNRFRWNGYAASNKMQYYVSDIDNLKNSEIQSVCFFISQEVDVYDLTQKSAYFDKMVMATSGFTDDYHDEEGVFVGYGGNGWSHRGFTNTYFAKRRDVNKIIDDIEKINTLYLVKEINVEDLVENTWTDIDTRGNLGDALATREQMPLTALARDTYYPEQISAYNYRAHVYDYKTKLFNGYSLPEFAHEGGDGQYDKTFYSAIGKLYKWEAKVELRDSQGNTTVVNYNNSAVEQLVKGLTPFISYPSADAKSITIRVYQYPAINGQIAPVSIPDNATVIYGATFTFSHKMGLGISYYISPDLKPITLPVISGPAPLLVPSSDFASENTERFYKNGMKVSDVAYPNYFPPKYTYRIGNEKIIGVARLTTPVSQDNFGGNVLAVFCTDGIYMMTVDRSGGGVYTSQTPPVSQEVCVNKNSICEIGGAVFFAGDKGLMVLTGTNNVELFAPHLNGEPRFLPATTPCKEARGIYKKMVESTSILSKTSDDFADSISYVDFKNFLADESTHLVYISNKNKLLAYNENYDYSYFIDIQTRNTTKLTMSAVSDDNNIIGRTLWEKGTDTYTVHTFGYLSEPESDIPSLVLSRPIKVRQDFITSYRVVLTGYFDGEQGNWADLVVLGSIDGDHWRPIGVKEKRLNGGFHDIGCITERDSWKYLMFIFGGKLSHNSHIDSVDITVEARYNNKKR